MSIGDMSGDLTADEIRELLDLEPNATCGFLRVTFVDKRTVAPGGLPARCAAGRPRAAGFYYLAAPAPRVRLPRWRKVQLYRDYIGDPLGVCLLRAGVIVVERVFADAGRPHRRGRRHQEI